MTANVQISTIADAISGLTISGVTVVDIDHVPEDASHYCPILYPRPDNFVTNITFTPQSYGSDGQRKMDLEYSLSYRYLHAPIGSGSVLQNYAGIIAKLELILESILSNSTPSGSVDMQIESISDLGAITDVAGATAYHGVDFTLRVKEFAQ